MRWDSGSGPLLTGPSAVAAAEIVAADAAARAGSDVDMVRYACR